MRAKSLLTLVAFASLALAFPAMAAQMDERDPEDRPSPGREQIPPEPDPVVAGTGQVVVSPPVLEVGDVVTVNFIPTGGVTWGTSSPPGGTESSCPSNTRRPVTDEEATHLPIGSVGGPLLCRWTVTQPTNGQWATVSFGITGPCGDLELVRQGKNEFATCAGAHATDSYYVLGAEQGIHGFVRGEGGDPVSGTRVEIEGEGTHEFVVTSSSGHYSFTVRPGSYLVTPSYFDDERLGIIAPDDFDPRSRRVRVSQGGRQRADFTVKGAVLAGSVKDTQGRPIPGRTVAIRSNRGLREAITAHDGKYSITLPRARYVAEVREPPPVDPERPIRIHGPAYLCKMPGAAPDQNTCIVDLRRDRRDVNFEANPELDVQIEIADQPDASGRYLATILVRDATRQPVGNQEIFIMPQRSTTPRMLVCLRNGQRMSPTQPLPLGGDSSYDEFTTRTDDQGKIELYLWPGIQSGEFRLDVEVPETRVDSEKDSATLPLASRGSASSGAMAQRIKTALIAGSETGTTAEPSPNFYGIGRLRAGGETRDLSAWESLQKVMTALGAHDDLGFSIHPIHSAGGDAGVLLLARTPDTAVLDGVVGSLGGGESAGFYQVFDVSDFSVRAQEQPSAGSAGPINVARPLRWNEIEVATISLAEWVAAHGPAVAGDPFAGGEERAFTYFGWPARPESFQVPDLCAGIRPRSDQMTVASPVALVFTNDAGERAGVDAETQEPILEMEGANVAKDDDGDFRNYTLPKGNYTVTATGTGDGKATLAWTHGEVHQYLQVYRMDVREGDSGVFKLTQGGNDGSFIFGSQTVQGGSGLGLVVSGLPEEMPALIPKPYEVQVTNELGDPVPFAGIAIAGEGGYTVNAIADAEGKAEVLLYGPRPTAELAWEVGGPQAKLSGRILAGPVENLPVSEEARKIIGPEEAVYFGGDVGLTTLSRRIALILMIGLIATMIVYIRFRPAVLVGILGNIRTLASRVKSSAAGAARRAAPRAPVAPSQEAAPTTAPKAETSTPSPPKAKRSRTKKSPRRARTKRKPTRKKRR